MEKKSLKQRIFSNLFARIILGLMVVFGVVIIGQEIAGKILGLTGLDKDYRNLIKGIVVSLLAIITYNTFYRIAEKRTVTEISTKGIVQHLLTGILIGVILQSLTILVIYVNNCFKIASINPVSFIIIPLTVAFTLQFLKRF